jgi:hypothetical protein
MKDTWFNAMFNEDFDDYYKNIMNGIVDHINYRGCEGNDALVRDGDSRVGDDENDSNNNDNDNDDDNNDDDDNDSDEDD